MVLKDKCQKASGFSHLTTRHSPPNNSISLPSGPHCSDLPVLMHAEVHEVVIGTVDCGDWA